MTGAAAILVGVTAATAVLARDMTVLNGAEIDAAIRGNTVQGTMASGTRYTEFYAEDGEIRGDGYTGAWHVDSDRMCFRYSGEESATCWSVGRIGDEVFWLRGEDIDGSGMLVTGNPNAF